MKNQMADDVSEGLLSYDSGCHDKYCKVNKLEQQRMKRKPNILGDKSSKAQQNNNFNRNKVPFNSDTEENSMLEILSDSMESNSLQS